MDDVQTYSAFEGDRLLATGELAAVLSKAKKQVDRGHGDALLLFEDHTGKQVDFDFHGSLEEVIARACPEPAPARGRPKLGVLSREVSLLPRHWEWLEEQPNGISAALRRLIDEARKKEPGEARARLAREAAHRFMTAMAGNRRGYEDAMRALYAKDRAVFEKTIHRWPADISKHIARLAAPAF